ncbi:MAG: hypothetical protein OXU26_11685 [Acidobacteriota bacterium]|nr:hypothetical protein [Acidobacteriota bacterium]
MIRREIQLLAALGFLIAALSLWIGYGEGWSQDGQAGAPKRNPNYLDRNPFYFEGKVDYELLGIDRPVDAWEFMQRGIHRQDDLQDREGAIQDYRAAIERNNPENGTCQIVKTLPSTTLEFQQLTPAPCLFTPRLRLGYLLLHEDPIQAIELFRQVTDIDPQRLEVNALIGEAYEILGDGASDPEDKEAFYLQAVRALSAELALSPVTELTRRLTGDEANNAHAHWKLARIQEKLNNHPEALFALDQYLKATRWHSDVYPWRIPLAQRRMEQLRARLGPSAGE